ncbi:MAG: sugar transferase [Chloroflexota bacterium]
MLRRFSLSYTLFIRTSDALIVLAALAYATWLRINLNSVGQSAASVTFATPLPLYIIACGLWQIAFQLLGVYTPAIGAWLWREIQHIVFGHALASLLFFGVLYLTYRDYSRLQAVYFIGLVLGGTLLHRIVLRLINKITRRPSGKKRVVLVVGTDANAQRISKTISMYGWTGLNLLGYVKHHPADPVSEDVAQHVLGMVDDLPMLVERHAINEVIITMKSPDYAYVSRLIDILQYQVTNIRLAPDYSDLAYFHVSMENFGGIPLIGLREAVLSPSQRLTKRIFDSTIAALVIFFGWPIFLVVAIAIRLESPGPVIFKQQRIGEHGKLFTMLKFRSMTDSASVNTEQPLDPTNHKKRDDPRVTQVGRFIRRTSLDELPQFFNILHGEMSLVGPRPEMPWLVDKYEVWQRKRFEVPQGLTGWWQVTGRANKPMHLNTEDDLFYIRNYSLWLDLQIIFRTILIMVTGRGAF